MNSTFQRLLSLSLLVTSCMILSAQQNVHRCATHQQESDLTWLRSYQANPASYDYARRAGDDFVPVQIHLVGDDEGNGYYKIEHLLTQFCEVNERFDSTNFHFFFDGQFSYIDNDDYYNHTFSQGASMMREYNANDRVNIYYVSDPAGACGYFSPSEDGVAMAKSCAAPGTTTLAHELGHFFSLPHTFFGWEWGTPPPSQQERVSGSNCSSAADGFCDTPPDYAPYRWNCPTTGPFTDPDGVEFTPDGTLYMSYSNDGCTTRFSEEQRNAMRANYFGPRNELVGNLAPPVVDFEEVTLTEPADGVIESPFNYTVIKWEREPNATHYHVPLALNVSGTAVLRDIVTTDTFAILTDLPTLRRIYWKVKPFNGSSTCAPYSETREFTTSEIASGIGEIEGNLNSMTLSPNPARSGQMIRLSVDANEFSEATLLVHNASGSLMGSQAFAVSSGQTTLDLDTRDYPAGMYLVTLEGENFRSQVKMMLTR